MRTIVAYVATSFVAPLLSGLAGLVLLPIYAVLTSPLTAIRSRLTGDKGAGPIATVGRCLIEFIMGGLAVAVGVAIFTALSVEPTLGIPLMLAAAFGFNHLRRFNAAWYMKEPDSTTTNIEGYAVISVLAGIAFGALRFLS